MAYIKCCKFNNNEIYYWYRSGLFYLKKLDAYDETREEVVTKPIEYCPWCGILLDTNLLEE